MMKRVQAPTPKFYRRIRNIGIVLATLSSSILASPDRFPHLLVQIAGYLAVGAAVATALSQMATDEKGGQA